MKKKKKKFCFDLDGVICKTVKNYYFRSKPIQKNISKINKLYDEGNYILIFTSRFMGRSNDNEKLAHKKGFKFTLNQLNSWGVKFHKLKLGKPSYDIFIDDKALFFKKNWSTKL